MAHKKSRWPDSALEKVLYAGVEQIPYLGTAIAFKRAFYHPSEKMRTKSAFDFLEAAARDIAIQTEHDSFTVMLVHAVASAMTDEAVSLWDSEEAVPEHKRKNGEEIKVPKSKFKPGHQYVVIPHKDAGETSDETNDDDEDDDAIKQKLENAPTEVKTFVNDVEGNMEVRAALTYHGAAFTGKFDYGNYAVDENFLLYFPVGIHEGVGCLIFTTWTKSAGNVEKKPFTQTNLKVHLDLDSAEEHNEGVFKLIQEGEIESYYSWKVTFADTPFRCKVNMYAQGSNESIAEFTLKRSLK